ncbi:hypothetical protein CC1G_01659 [Coprinopsis cinerea okayama7|uniref:Uncharacterized protein n=1 Tax=Coprinopsis cinerea (strain Okayama-7 / 130 / ATCC MYA-4618 / FGSC 9003) TaxID=240176 RepID=A8NIE5_COPC7|nr:hypothetical protein CC1G_01659 [Coprinopsis cinerea okayama7\|eukprot:XP_001833982.1 hypothetical protein CC1G_01659 [Coprinopsis cinerea okayama7\
MDHNGQALMCFQIIIADSIMVWRLWVIYERSLLASVIPTLLWAGGLVITIWTVYLRIHVAYRPGATEEDYPPELHAICMALWALTISLNLYTTSAIVLRIWRADRETKACLRASQFNRDIQPPSYLKQTMKIVIESGLIHSAVTVSVFICLALRTNASYITTAIDIIVIGITFNLIVLRVASRRLRESHAKQSSVDFVTSSTLNGYLAETGSCASSLRSRDGPIQSPSIGDGRPVVHIDPLDGQERQPQPHV